MARARHHLVREGGVEGVAATRQRLHGDARILRNRAIHDAKDGVAEESETMSATEESSERTVTSTTPLAFVVAAMAPEETKSATTNRAKSGSPPVCLYTAPWSAMGSPTKCERFNRWRFASRPERRWRTFLPSPDVDEWSDPEDAPSAPEETLPSFPPEGDDAPRSAAARDETLGGEHLHELAEIAARERGDVHGGGGVLLEHPLEIVATRRRRGRARVSREIGRDFQTPHVVSAGTQTAVGMRIVARDGTLHVRTRGGSRRRDPRDARARRRRVVRELTRRASFRVHRGGAASSLLCVIITTSGMLQCSRHARITPAEMGSSVSGVLHEQQKTRERGLRGRRLHGSTEKKPLEHQRERLAQTRHALARARARA